MFLSKSVTEMNKYSYTNTITLSTTADKSTSDFNCSNIKTLPYFKLRIRIGMV